MTANRLRSLGATLLLLATGSVVAMESANLRVAFIDGPAADAMQAGRAAEAIRILETLLEEPDRSPQADELGTLCAAYILDRRFGDAREICDAAVVADGSDMAFNNRGVLRAHLGDFQGALRDFARIRVPEDQVERYIEQLASGNARLMASDNFALIRRVQGVDDDRELSLSRRPAGAEVETVVN